MLSRQNLMLLTLGCVLLWASAAQAVPTQGTSAGTIITAVSTNLSISYQDPNNNIQPTVNASNDVTTSVSAIYGLDKSGFSIANQTILPGDAAVYEVYFRNVANTSDTVSFNYDTVSINYQGNSGGSWNLSPLSPAYQTLSEFAVATVSFTVTASNSAENGSKGFVTVNAITERTPVGTYQGFNTNTYGGPPTLNHILMTTVSGPDVIIQSKYIHSVEAPTSGGYNGNASDLVPGSKIEYFIVLKNIGTTANNVTLEQKIPDDTQYDGATLSYSGLNLGSVDGFKDLGAGFVSDVDSGVFDATRIRIDFQRIPSGIITPRYVTVNFRVIVK